ncbi:MAG: hypothetical protein IJK46_06980 [Prevotella sp.]|nr:hypothetical protein [Prevotella sp.]
MIHYTKEYIGQLLERYMDGTSTLEEEDIIANYLKGNDVPQEWEVYRQMFQEIEDMQPAKATRRNKRWVVWSIAAAIVIAFVAFISVQLQERQQQSVTPLLVKTDTTSLKRETEMEKPKPDTVQQNRQQVQPVKPKKRSLRKPEPTIDDYAKAYALMAEAERQQQEEERQIAEIEMQIQQDEMLSIQPLMEEMGYVAVRHEDGTIYYINENEKDIAYEE